jgi:excinuclease ABC subunit A
MILTPFILYSERMPEKTKDYLEIYGAREHNLKNIDVRIPRNALVVVTGLSGSGKSSLAFDTIYAEGQRRYMETFSAYARQFIGELKRPDVDKIEGLSPVIAIEQKSIGKNPRSTVGTITEVYDFLRLLYAKVADAYSYVSHKKMQSYTEKQIIDLIKSEYDQKKIAILAPLVKGRKGHYRELLDNIRRKGFTKVRIDGALQDLVPQMQLDRYKVHDIEVVIDRIKLRKDKTGRLAKAVELSLKQGKGTLMVMDYQDDSLRHLSKAFVCPDSGISYDTPEPNSFSFNSPYGACKRCNGLGTINEVELDKVFPNRNLSIRNGGMHPLGEYKNSWIFQQLDVILKKHHAQLSTPIKDFSEDLMHDILYGTDENLEIKKVYSGVTSNYHIEFEGLISFLERQQKQTSSVSIKRWAEAYMTESVCPVCHGQRLKKESLHFRIGGKNITEVANMDLSRLKHWVDTIADSLNEKKKYLSYEILRELSVRIDFLLEVGLDYLALNRPAKSLSGGESQRIRLATQIGSQLTNVLYILDEPSIGLHQRDNRKLIASLQDLRDIGNSVIVVEHDEEMMQEADYLIDIGPGAGRLGGEIVASGTADEVLASGSVTAQYLSGKRKIKVPRKRRPGNGKFLKLSGAEGNNLKSVTLKLPLGMLVCVTGVSGSGKSTLINETLYPVLMNTYFNSHRKPLKYKSVTGLKHLDKVVNIDQSPIGRSPRSNPATYTNVFDEIRKLYAALPESKIRNYKVGRFSFNVKGGRCETCKGGGVRLIEMNFLPDVYVTCEDCRGKRYNRETLEVRYKGKSINDVLEMTIRQAVDFFEKIPKINKILTTLNDVGLGYITLGQSSVTLSGGEAQRVKLATELAKRDTGNTLYILDEPTTGLHFEDVKVLLDVLQRLVDKGNTVLIIEHNLDVIKVADYIIDIGPEGGDKGGEIVFAGTPENLLRAKNSHTAIYLKEKL